MKRKADIELFLHSSGDYRITDQFGKTYTPGEARLLCDNGRVRNCNLAFERLATLNFDVQATRDYYAEQNRRLAAGRTS